MGAPTGAPIDPQRRTALKAGIAGAIGATALTRTEPARAQAVFPASPPTTPWMEAMPVQTPKTGITVSNAAQLNAALTNVGVSPLPGINAVAGEAGRNPHQAWTRFPPRVFYEMRVQQANHQFHPQLPPSSIWGFDGQIPGPLFHARYGQPILVRIRNELPANAAGPGSPEISTHLHNMHTPSESDGFTGDWFSPTQNGPTLTGPGAFKDHHYPMVYAGVDAFGGIGDSREALGTLWYHDHRTDFTAGNVYRGLVGFFLAFDHIDTGNENDPSPQALRLPSGEYDVPMVLADRRFNPDGQLFFDQFNNDGFLGDKYTVNGKIQPFFRVARRKYRFRFLDGGPARIYDLVIKYQGRDQSFYYIGNDGNLLPNPLLRTSVRLGVAERADIVVDFAKFPIGAEVFLVNRAEMTDGRGTTGRLLNPGDQMLKFIVDRNPPTPDTSRVPVSLRPLPPINLAEVTVNRQFVFNRAAQAWTVNDQIFDVAVAAARPQKGTAEIWELVNGGRGWWHPVHIHFEEGRILSRNGAAPAPHEAGRKDVYHLGPGDTVRIFIRFRDFPGKYLMHCHNLIHEDHGMMIRYDIEP